MTIVPRLRTLWKAGRRTFGVLLALLATYALIGFIVLPAVLRTQLPRWLGALLHRQVSLQRVRVNPFSLSITLDGFRIQDRDGLPFLGWERLYLNVEASSLVSRTLAFKTIHLAKPYGRIALDREGRPNFADLLERQTPAASPSGPPRSVRIGQLRIQGARVDLLDRGPAEPFATTLGPVNLALDGFRSNADEHSPYAFSGRTARGESFAWTGTFSADPLRSTGFMRIDQLQLAQGRPYLQNRVAFKVQDGALSLSTGYTLEWTPQAHTLKLQGGSLDLLRLILAWPDSGAPALTLPALEVRGIEADLLARQVAIQSLRLRDGKLALVRRPDGSLDLQTLFTPRPEPGPKEPSQPFALTIHELGLQGFQASVEDRVPARPVRVDLRDLDLTLRELSLDPKAASDLDLSLRINEQARLSLQGSIKPFRPSADLRVRLTGLALPAFDPYLEPALAARINRGSLALDGRARYDGNGNAGEFTGNLQVTNLEVMDAAQGEPFLRYRSLGLNGLDLRTRPARFSLQDADLFGHEYRLVIAPDGSSNVARALKLAAQPAPAPAPLSALGAAFPATPEPVTPIQIRQVRVRKGQLSFIDRSLEPNAVLLITDLEGENHGLSTVAGETSSLTLKGLAGGTGPILIQGRAQPLAHDRDTDVAVTISGANLTDFSPYAGKFLGYGIREGKLSLEARVRIRERKLQVEDALRMDQFYLGDKVPSPDATHLPVKLGLALLRDRKGQIRLEVPVDGSLDEPDVHYGRMIWRAILNALGKVVASPFTLLSKLYGGGADISSIAFPAGRDTLEAAAASTLDTLVKALHDRPELRLQVEGSTDASDAAALRKDKLEDLLRRQRNAARRDPNGPGEDAPVAPGEREPLLRAAFAAAFPAGKGDAKLAPAPAEMEQRLLATLSVSSAELTALADARSRATVTRLLAGNLLEPERIFQVQGSEAAKAGGPRVFFVLQ